MADNDPLKDLPEAADMAEELVTLSTDPMKLVAKKTVNAYTQATLAAVMAVPLMTCGGVPTISNVQARPPDENVPSQSQDTNVAHQDDAEVVSTGSTTVSASLSINYEGLAQLPRRFTPGRVGFR